MLRKLALTIMRDTTHPSGDGWMTDSRFNSKLVLVLYSWVMSERTSLSRGTYRIAWDIMWKTPWVIKVLITLHVFMDTIKNKTAIKKIADCRAESPKDPISSWSTWWTHWQADCFPVPIFGACEKWSTQPVCGLRWVINLVLSPPWW